MKVLLINIIVVSLSTSIFILFWLAIKKYLNHIFSYRINRLIWLAIALRLLFCTSFLIPSFSQKAQINPEENKITTNAVSGHMTEPSDIPTKSTVILVNNQEKIIISNIVMDGLVAIWILGFTVSLIKKLISYLLICHKVKRGKLLIPIFRAYI